MKFPKISVHVRKRVVAVAAAGVAILIDVVRDNPQIIDSVAGKVQIGGAIGSIVVAALLKRAIEKKEPLPNAGEHRGEL